MEKKKCNGCGDYLKKGDKYVRIGDLIICEHCIENNWNEEE